MTGHYTTEELLAFGFETVGCNPMVSRNVIFHVLSGHLGDRVRIDDFAVITGEVLLSDDAHVSTHCFLGGTGAPIRFGKRSGVGAGTVIYTKSEDYTQPTLGAKVTGPVSLQDSVAVGSHCTIMPNSIIGEGAKVGAHALVSGPVRAHTISVSRAASLLTVAEFEAAS